MFAVFAKSYAFLTAFSVASNAVLVLLVASLNLVTPYALVLAAGILAVPLLATSVPLACTFVIVPVPLLFHVYFYRIQYNFYKSLIYLEEKALYLLMIIFQ